MCDSVDEGLVLGIGEQERRVLGILGVAHGDETAIKESDLDAIRSTAAKAAGVPLCVAELRFEPGRIKGVLAHAKPFAIEAMMGMDAFGLSASDFSRSLVVL